MNDLIWLMMSYKWIKLINDKKLIKIKHSSIRFKNLIHLGNIKQHLIRLNFFSQMNCPARTNSLLFSQLVPTLRCLFAFSISNCRSIGLNYRC